MVGIYIGEVVIPFMPAAIRLTNKDFSSRHFVLGKGEVEILNGEKLQEIGFEGWLPAQKLPGMQTFSAPNEIKEKLCSYVQKKEPVRFVYVGKGWDINFLSSIHDLDFVEKGGEAGALYYSLVIRKWVDYSAKKIDSTSNSLQTRKNEKQTPKTYVVQKGDCLFSIAKATTGNAQNWTQIYQHNKDSIKNPNLIYPGQVIVLPKDENTNNQNKHQNKVQASPTIKQKNNYSVGFPVSAPPQKRTQTNGISFGEKKGTTYRVGAAYTKAIY